MTFEEYQNLAQKTALYPSKGNNFVYPTLGLVGEAGEVAEKIKKILRDDGGVINEAKKQELIKELGDVLWYIAGLAAELDVPLEQIAQTNLEKLASRRERGKIGGSGDNR